MTNRVVQASKVAIVTGASRGIGAACAIALARGGLRVYLVAEGTEEELRAVSADCVAAHPQAAECAYGLFDLSKPEAAIAVAEAAASALGRVDVLVNNAGIRIRKPFGTFSSAEFDEVFAVNLRAALLLSQAVLPFMRAEGGGRIIHMASQLGLVADPGAALYGMTKAALIHLTRVMALELAMENIQVNAVSPGPIGTDYYLERVRQEPDLLARRLAAVPMKRLGTPEEVAEAVAFLATTNASYIQGHNLVVDGGFIIH
ncbi:glucose 1-dehydrogenase [Aquabacter sp. CN5-332]|uniref:SDR family NAD(P)-dependent oxidoreductase n=1 Tax=Aquabacter sp. CN5-332 TaxID=3156608 RepID=UPI0032B51B4A